MKNAKNLIDMKMDDGRILRFNGKLLAEIDDSRVEGLEEEIERDFWQMYKLYITDNAKFIIYHAVRWKSTFEQEKYKIFSDKQELIEYAIKKEKRLLFKLLKKAKIPIIIEVE
ncbi:MAG: hypothetical protein ACFFAH_16645 [Promethearchaeota archaeon]